MLVIVTPPAAEPVTSTEAKAHLRVDTTDDDTLITSLITAARTYAERVLRRALISQTWDLTLDEWPDGNAITIPLPPLQSVTSLKYTDDDGTVNTMSSSWYIVDTASTPGRLVLKDDYSWPSDDLREAMPIVVRFVAGYGAAGSSVPGTILTAIKLLIGHWYENREAQGGVPEAVDLLLWPDRVIGY